MTDLQRKLLEMLKWLTNYFDENNYKYYVVGGTLLGAIRHKGFIPWDDDIDIALPRPDYNRLCKTFDSFDSPYKLETPYENNVDYLYTYSKLFDTRTTLIEKQRKNIVRGIFIDIFPLDGAGNTYEEAYNIFTKVNSKNMFLMTRVCALRKERKISKNVSIILSRCIPFINNKKLSLKVDELASKKSYDDSSYVANFNGAYGKKEIVEKKIFGKPTNYSFENIIVKGPELYDEYLRHMYGNWMILPPIEKRGIQHDFTKIDLEKSYLDNGDY